MIGYRRNFAPRDSLYFNVRLVNRRSNLLVQEFETLRLATRETMRRYPFRIDVITVLPSEIMTIWTLPKGDTDYASRWAMVQSLFAGNLPARAPGTGGSQHVRETRIWDRRINKRQLATNMDYESYRRHIQLAPMSEGFVTYAEDWPYSSLHPDMTDAFANLQQARAEYPATPPSWTVRHQRRIRASG